MNTNKIKIEPGTSKLPTVLKYEEGRLQSLVPRNLKLGTKPKVFKPNLVERKKKNDSIADSAESPRGRGRGRGRGERGRGAPRGRNAQNFIQSHGVFSEGMSEGQKRQTFYSDRTHASNKESDAAKVMDKPTFNKGDNYKIDKEHEEKVMLQLYDDHIDQDQDIVNELYPINLPTLPKIKVKKEIEVEHFEGIDDVKVEPKVEKYLFNEEEKLMLFQFPDCLPGLGSLVESEKPEKPNNSSENNAEKPEVRNKCTLRDIDEGKIGKILIYKSGKTKLLIGNSVFDIDEGFNPGFLQDVISVNANLDTKSGDMINLGSIQDSIVVTPQFDELLNK